MDKYEYKQKTEELLDCIAVGDYLRAESIADAVDWRRVKNVNMLYAVSEVYDQCGRYEDAREILFIAYDRAPNNRRIIFGLAELAIKTGQRIEARDCYDEFVAVAPHDPGKYILQYEILKNEDAPLEEQIEALEKYKKQDYTERWSYELAKLYEKAGMTAKCVAECDDLFLWFSEGKYVYKALELKRKYRPLTANQTDALNSASGYESMPDEYDDPADVEEQYGQVDTDAEFDEQFISEYQYDDVGSELEEASGSEELSEPEEIPDLREVSSSDDYDDNIQNVNPLCNTRDFGEEFAKAKAEEEQKNQEFQDEMERQADFEVEDLSVNIAQFVNEFVDGNTSDETLENEEPEINENINSISYEDSYEGSEETENGLKIDYYGDLSAAIMSQLTAKVPTEEVKETLNGDSEYEEAEEEIVEEQEEETVEEPEQDIAEEAEEVIAEEPVEETEDNEPVFTGYVVEQPESPLSEEISDTEPVEIITEAPKTDNYDLKGFADSFCEFEGASRFDFIAEQEQRLKAEKEETERLKNELAEVMRRKAEMEEAARLRDEKEAADKIAAEQAEAARIAAEEQRLFGEAEQAEAYRLEIEQAEAARLEVEKLEAEQAKAARREELAAIEAKEAARIAAEELRLSGEAEQAEAFRLETEQFEAARLEAEKLEAEREEAERLARMAERENEKEEIELERKAAINRARQEQETRMEAVRKNAREEAEKLAAQRTELEKAKNMAAEEAAARIAERKAYDDEQQRMMDETIRKRVEAATSPLIDQIAGLTLALKHQMGDEMPSVVLPERVEIKTETDVEINSETKSETKPEIKPEIESEIKPEIKEESKKEIKNTVERKETGIPKSQTAIGNPDSDIREHYEVDNIAAALADLAFSKDIDFSKLEKEGREELERKLAQKKASLYESLSRRSIVGSQDRMSSSDSANGIPLEEQFDLDAQRRVGIEAGLTEEQKNLFSYFVPVRGMSEQLVEVLRKDPSYDRRGTSRMGNITITGPSGNGKTVLGVDLVKAIQKQRSMRSGKIAIISAEALNRKDIPDTISKIIGGALIIEDAGSLSQSTVRDLNDVMEGNTKETLFVLEDEKEAIDDLFRENPKFAFKFGSSIEIPVFADDELVTFGMSYAREHGYKIDEMGILALYSRIDILQREDHNVTVADVKDIMDDAFDHARQSSMRRTMTSLFKRNDTSELTSLREEDFA